ncbi:DUF5994 family protein [Mycobacterium vicinigordonae]|uniref:Uncharacterized protein n=1 Tax=Mycobacterium vicinigordonae TaxID=1719132 RepID=A0A7D6I333_9MYCO|nr:DUF5994 family protein [Mycobacterium vicinigordonae]QLL08834.1 hypothetical protein H0P51_07990 [Mycobacterium vicinigordonae]
MTYPLSGRRRSTPIRLTLASELGHDIDGAWWPRTDRISGELPDLVAAVGARLGEICEITINWPPLQRPPDLNWQGWQRRNQHVIVLESENACAKVLIVPYNTHSALAMMVLRRAAKLHVSMADRETASFRTAGSILCAAMQQLAPNPSSIASL